MELVSVDREAGCDRSLHAGELHGGGWAAMELASVDATIMTSSVPGLDLSLHAGELRGGGWAAMELASVDAAIMTSRRRCFAIIASYSLHRFTSKGQRLMSELSPIYTADNCRFAAPLQWSVTIFWQQAEHRADWLEQLAIDLEPDENRIISHRFSDHLTSQFTSTLPHVSPQLVVQRLKGRLYYLVRSRKPKPFKRPFAIRRIGKLTRQSIRALYR